MIHEQDRTGDAAILYTQAGCEDSARTRAWLTERGVAFLERDVTTDPAAARALYECGTFATPLLQAGDAEVLGFRSRELAAALWQSGGTSRAIGPAPPSVPAAPVALRRPPRRYPDGKERRMAAQAAAPSPGATSSINRSSSSERSGRTEAAAFASTCSGVLPPGMATETAGWLRTKRSAN